MKMTKAEAIAIFDNNGAELARALKVSRSAISQWPDELTQDQADRVIGAAVRTGRMVCEKPGEEGSISTP